MNEQDSSDEVNVLQLSIHGVLVGYLAGFKNGRNVLSIADTFKNNPDRPTFSLIAHPKFPNATKLMAAPWARNQRLHPVLSNLLPEGSLRELIAQGLKVQVDNEFHILSYLGEWRRTPQELELFLPRQDHPATLSRL